MTAAYYGDFMDDSIDNVSASDDAAEFMGDAPSEPSDGPFTGLKNLLGSLGTNAQTITRTARDVGTAIGTVKAQVKGAPAAYKAAENAAANPSAKSSIKQWLLYATPTDKIMVAIGIAALGITAYQAFKGK